MTEQAKSLLIDLRRRFGERSRVFKEEILDLMDIYDKKAWRELFDRMILGYECQILFIEWSNVPRETS